MTNNSTGREHYPSMPILRISFFRLSVLLHFCRYTQISAHQWEKGPVTNANESRTKPQLEFLRKSRFGREGVPTTLKVLICENPQGSHMWNPQKYINSHQTINRQRSWIRLITTSYIRPCQLYLILMYVAMNWRRIYTASRFLIHTDGLKIQTRKRLPYDPSHTRRPPDWLQAFIKAQNSLFKEYISNFPHIDSYRRRLFLRSGLDWLFNFSLTRTFDYERYDVPYRFGNRWYYAYNEGLKPQSVCYALDNATIESNAKGTVFFDINTLSEDGTLSVWQLQINVNVYS